MFQEFGGNGSDPEFRQRRLESVIGARYRQEFRLRPLEC